MKWCLCTIAFREDDVREVITRAAGLGFDEVEIIGKQVDGKSGAELDAIAETAADAGIAISGVSPYFWLTQNEKLLAESMAIADRFVKIARRLDARMIRTFTDAGPTGIGSAAATPQHWSTAVDALKAITAMAPEITFALETHQKTLADTPVTTERVLDEVGAENLKVLYQPFRADSVVEDFLRLEPQVRQIHLNPHIAPRPEGGIRDCGFDYGALLETLARRRYPHSCALEYCVPGEGNWEEIAETFAWCQRRLGGER